MKIVVLSLKNGISFLLLFSLFLIKNVSAATIQTDKQNYEFGETVFIYGMGFLPGQDVGIEIRNPNFVPEGAMQSTPDQNGNFTNSWPIGNPDPIHIIEGTYTVYATSQSGSAQTTFKVSSHVVTCGISATDINFGSVNAGNTSTEQTITLNNIGNSPTTSLTIKGNSWTGTPSGSMSVSQTHWYLTSGQDYNSMTPLTEVDSSLGQQVSPDSPLIVYSKLMIPDGQNAASYTQTITFTGNC